MPLSLLSLSLVDAPVTPGEGRKVLARDNDVCRYCGWDGRASFENALVMRIDFVIPRAHKGKKDPNNLVACCTACNTLKGKAGSATFVTAQNHVLDRRGEL